MADQIKEVRQALQAADESLFTSQNRLRAAESELINTRRLGTEGAQRAAGLERDIDSLKTLIDRNRSNQQTLKGQLSDLVDQFVLPQTPQQLASQLDDSLPCLLLPLVNFEYAVFMT